MVPPAGWRVQEEQQRNEICPWLLGNETVDTTAIPKRKVARICSSLYFLF
jgi:hypothetical protein